MATRAAGSSAEPHRTSAYSNDLQWRMVYQQRIMGLSCREVAKNLCIDASTVSRVVNRFDETGEVDATHRSGRPTKLTQFDEFLILENILQRPSTYLQELVQDMRKITGTEVDPSTICRFLKKNNFSRKKLQRIAQQQNAELRSQFVSDCSVYKPEQLVFIDETGTDRRDCMRKFGYGLVGKRACSTSLLVRGKRFSSIAILSLEGILDSYITPETVNAEKFQEFVEKCLLRHLMPFDGVILIVWLPWIMRLCITWITHQKLLRALEH